MGYSRGGVFDLGSRNSWNQRRSGLNHTALGNGVLRVWSDPNRWPPVIAQLIGQSSDWSPDSHRKWDESFECWQQVRCEVIALARRIEEDFRPWLPSEDLFSSRTPVVVFSSQVAGCVAARSGRFREWLADVEQAVDRVDQAVARLRPAVSQVEGLIDSSQARQLLEQLVAAGSHLKVVFSGSGYFQQTSTD